MKRAFMSETAIMRSFLPSIAGVGLFIFVVLTLANATDGDSRHERRHLCSQRHVAHHNHELAGWLR